MGNPKGGSTSHTSKVKARPSVPTESLIALAAASAALSGSTEAASRWVNQYARRHGL